MTPPPKSTPSSNSNILPIYLHYLNSSKKTSMKKYYPTLIRVLFCTLLFVCARCASAQYQYARYVSTGPNSGGYYEYVPAGYNSYQNTKKYPLIVFLHGAGQFGNGDSAQLPRVLATAIPHLIAEHQWPDSFKVNGSTFQFIV